MNSKDKIKFIVDWIKSYVTNINKQPVSLVIGVSGGVDSALTSTLCAKTGLRTIPVNQAFFTDFCGFKHNRISKT